MRLFKSFVGSKVVSADAKYWNFQVAKGFKLVSKLTGFGGASWRKILGIKVQNQRLAEELAVLRGEVMDHKSRCEGALSEVGEGVKVAAAAAAKSLGL